MGRFTRSKSALMSTEIMIGITLIIFAAFVMLGAFDKGSGQVSSDSNSLVIVNQ